MAKIFFEDVGSISHLHMKIAWRIEDNSTMNVETMRILNGMGIVVVAHSIEKYVDTTLYKTLVPNFHFIETRGFRQLISELSKFQVSLRHREPSVFWAGSTTGVPCHGKLPCNNSCHDIQRAKLVRLGKNLNWANFSITKAIQWCAADGKKMGNLISQPIRESEWVHHKGLLDVDGNVDAWGLTWRLASGSVVFRVRSSYLNYFSDKLVEGVHYIAISEDFSDLAEKTAEVTVVRYTGKHARIARNAKQIIQENSYEVVVKEVARELGSRVQGRTHNTTHSSRA